jgi:hypothetical protein
MIEGYLVPETTVRDSGDGHALHVGAERGFLLLTLGITRTVEKESLNISIWGSPDGVYWGDKPIFTLPRRFYCGIYQNVFDLSEHDDVKFLRAKWQVNQWGRGDRKPLFTVYLHAQQSLRHALAASA